MGVVAGIEQDFIVVGPLVQEAVLPVFQDNLDLSHPIKIPNTYRGKTKILKVVNCIRERYAHLHDALPHVLQLLPPHKQCLYMGICSLTCFLPCPRYLIFLYNMESWKEANTNMYTQRRLCVHHPASLYVLCLTFHHLVCTFSIWLNKSACVWGWVMTRNDVRAASSDVYIYLTFTHIYTLPSDIL